jgi:hypothetical protein
MSKDKVNQFLEKARAIHKETEKINKSVSPMSSKRDCTPATRSSNTNKSFASPVSHQSFISSSEDSPKSSTKKFMLSNTILKPIKANIPANQTIDNISKVEVIVDKIAKSSQNLNKDIEKHFKFENSVLENLSAALSTQKKILESNPKIKEIEDKNHKKMKEILKLFKSEALKMDMKLNSLRLENTKLKSVLDIPQAPKCNQSASIQQIFYRLSSGSFDYKFAGVLKDLCDTCKPHGIGERSKEFVANWFDCLRVNLDEYRNFMGSIAKKIIEEQQKRLKTEEETSKMMEYEEKIIETLELKLKIAEAKHQKNSYRKMQNS